MREFARNIRAVAIFVLVATAQVRPAGAVLIFKEEFSSDPVVAGRAVPVGDGNSTPGDRFTYTPGKITAHYDSGLDTALLNWSLDATLTTADDFRFEVDFQILSSSFVALPNANPFAQLSFGLANETTTGLNRLSDSRDIAMIDYFPSESTVFDGLPALGPVMIASSGDFFSAIEYPFEAEAGLDDISQAGNPEERPPLDVLLTVIFVYEAAPRKMTLQIDSPGGLLEINQIGFTDVPGTSDVGGPDDDVTTIEHQLPPGYSLSVDSFALALWDFGSSTVVADIEFSRLAVFDGRLPGDMNGDGVVDLLDTGLFIQALVDRPAFETAYPLVDADLLGDINEDGQFDLGDLGPFGDLFNTVSSAAVPEPSLSVLLVGLFAAGLTLTYRRARGKISVPRLLT